LQDLIAEAILKILADIAANTMKNAGGLDKKAQALREAAESQARKIFAKAIAKVLD
jgi:hypothetical protein